MKTKRQMLPKNLLPPDLTKKLVALEKADLDGKALMALAHQWYLCTNVCQKIGVMLEKRGKAKLYPANKTPDSAIEGE